MSKFLIEISKKRNFSTFACVFLSFDKQKPKLIFKLVSYCYNRKKTIFYKLFNEINGIFSGNRLVWTVFQQWNFQIKLKKIFTIVRVIITEFELHNHVSYYRSIIDWRLRKCIIPVSLMHCSIYWSCVITIIPVKPLQ